MPPSLVTDLLLRNAAPALLGVSAILALILPPMLGAAAFGQSLCDATPKATCRAAGKSGFSTRVGSSNAQRDRVLWKWREGEATDVADFGDPSNTTNYALCLYDTSAETPSLVMDLEVSTGSSWKTSRKGGFRYRDEQLRIRLESRSAGKSRLVLKGKGASLPVPAPAEPQRMFHQDPIVAVQLVANNGECWGTGYHEAAIRNDANRFKAKVSGQHNGACIRSGDQDSINGMLTEAGSKAVLCPNATFELTAPVIFSEDDQEIYTLGLPTDSTRALLRVASADVVNAVDGSRRSRVKLRNVIVDGNMTSFGAVVGAALLQFGGYVSDLLVEWTRAYDARGWTILHIGEGNIAAGENCTGAQVKNNEFIGGLGDGISLACTNSIVSDNTVTDVFDGGIVVFGAPGSLISGNTIRASTRTLFGGINMVDEGLYGGNYTSTVVTGNTIDAAGAPIRIGLAMGFHTWGCSLPGDPVFPPLIGGTVTNNTLMGDYMGYGFAVDGVTNWTVTGNSSVATHSYSLACEGHSIVPPRPFQKHALHSSGTFQVEFEEADLHYISFF